MGPVIICRCEEITDEEIAAAVAEGAASPREVRLRTRAGMGVCGGRTCRHAVARLLAEAGLPEAPGPRWRPPVRPVLLGDLSRRPDGGEGPCA